MGLKFEGVLENIHENVLNSCSSFLENHGVTDSKVRVEVVGQKGDNYVAIVRRFIAQDGRTEKPFQMVVKIAPTDLMTRKMMQTEPLFNNESLIYTKILPKYREFEESASVPKKSRLRSALCYGVHLEEPHECIALEDLNEHGFFIADRLKSLTHDEVRLIINDLAKLHALCFVLKERDNPLFEEMKNKLQNMWSYYDANEEFKAYLNFVETQVELALDRDDHKKRIKGIMKLFTSAAKNMHKSDLRSKHAIIIQGDCWTNNFMFKREDGMPVEAIMLDYQLARVSSPVVDLQYMIFNCTDSDTRKNNYHEWLDYYYDTLTKCLDFYGLKVNYIYPRDKFDADLQRYAKNSMGLAFLLASVLVRESEEVVDFKETGFDAANMDMEKELSNLSISNMKEATAERFKNRIQGIVKDFITYGYI